MDNKILLAALKYAKDGIPLIPLCAYNHEGISPDSAHATKICKCPGKVALIKWKEITETTQQDIIAWKGKFKAFNIGMPLGSSSGYVGIDIDGDEGQEMFKEMVAGKNVPETWEFTSGDGRRLLFTIPIGIKTKKLVNTGQGTHQECSILADGQYTVIPPSIHHTGRRYSWRVGHSPEEIDCAPAPLWLLDLITDKTPKKQEKLNPMQMVLNLTDSDSLSSLCVPVGWSMAVPPEVSATGSDQGKEMRKAPKNEEPLAATWVDLEKIVVSEGGRNNAITKYIGSLLADPGIRKLGKETALFKVKKYNEKCLLPPLPPEEYTPQFEAFWSKEQGLDAQYAKVSNDKLAWNASDALDVLRNKLSEEHLYYIWDSALKAFYYCEENKGPWKEDLESSKISSVLIGTLKNYWHRTDWVTPRRLRDVLDLYRIELIQQGRGARGLFIESPYNVDLQKYLPVNGNRLDWITGELLPWDVDFMTQANFDVQYDPKATCPYWEKYMSEWLPDAGIRKFLQMFLGSALLPRPDPCGVFVILLGGGANGKSMFMDAIEDIFGINATAQELSRLQERFGVATLYGKRLNICSELEDNNKYLANTGILKRLVTGETLNIEFKGKDSFDYTPIASHIFSCNTLPNTGDKTLGWFRRMRVVPFERVFTPDGGVAAEMRAHIAEERSGIFNWLVQGLREFTANGNKYPEVQKLIETNEKIRAEQDSIRGFEQLFLKRITGREGSTYFMQNYGKDCKAHGIGLRFLYLLYKIWYKYTISDKGTPLSAKKFQEDLSKRFDFVLAGHKKCLLSEKNTLCVLNVDFSYSDEMCDMYLELMEEDEIYSNNSKQLENFKKLLRFVQMHIKERETE